MTSKKKKDDTDEDVYLGVGAAGDPHNPGERLSPNAPSAVVFAEPVPNEDSVEPKKKEDSK